MWSHHLNVCVVERLIWSTNACPIKSTEISVKLGSFVIVWSTTYSAFIPKFFSFSTRKYFNVLLEAF